MREMTTSDVTPGRLAAGALAGLLGGLAGAWAMNQVSPVLGKLGELAPQLAGSTPRDVERRGATEHARPELSHGEHGEPLPRVTAPAPGANGDAPGGRESESSTVKVARTVSRTIAGRDLRPGTEAAAGNAVHFAFGGALATAYGMLAEILPEITAGRGLLWGLVVWAVADEAALPLVGLSGPPGRYPLSTHALALTGHCVFGVTTEVVRRAVHAATGTLAA
ncbi:MAG TPA: DUF1440 domain-containing protein [Methylomirabilota bacterium]|jgi:hypothetical protein|nr:DUF1440 domain-containing protein [Methylomirabilota bacterium]